MDAPTEEEEDTSYDASQVISRGKTRRLVSARSPRQSSTFMYLAVFLALATLGLSAMHFSLRQEYNRMEFQHLETIRNLRAELNTATGRAEVAEERANREEANALKQRELADSAQAAQERLQELLKKAIESVQIANRDASVLIDESSKVKPSGKSPLAIFQQNANNTEFRLRVNKLQERNAQLLLDMQSNGEITEVNRDQKTIWVHDRAWNFFDSETRKALIEMASDYFAFLSDNTDYSASIRSSKDGARLASATKDGWVQLY